ncbi:MAG: hypothetical protein ACREEP_10985 [Dongiaceae bacterium]
MSEHKPKPKYTPLPAVPPELLPRLAAVVEVLAGLTTVSAAARALGLSRNHFQSLLHRGIAALTQAIAAQPGGRPARPAAIATLQTELTRLQRENARLQKRVGSTERLLEVASGLLQGRIRPAGRQARRRKSTGSRSDGNEDSEPASRPQQILAGVDEMRALGMSAVAAATIAGMHAATVRRWRARADRGLPCGSRGRSDLVAQPMRVAAANQVATLVRELHGLIGADALRHSVVGISRRAAARVKAQTLTAMERERKVALARITITVAGVVRGMDAMQFPQAPDARYALICADGAVPYRTSLITGRQYDAHLVARALHADLEQNGAPLVYRLDRARAHDAPAARAVLAAHQVLVLHGPPRYPCYYGQLERQNREHRAWIGAEPAPAGTALEPRLVEMLDRVNRLWRRRTLGWQTAAEVWSARPPLKVDRQALREEVDDRAIRIAHTLTGRGQPADLAERLAIEQTLTRMGYLRQEMGAWC